MKKHIVICGQRGVGKTTMTERLMREITVPVYGYQTKSLMLPDGGGRRVYMFPAGCADGTMSEANHIGDCNRHIIRVNHPVFDGLGVRLLKEAKPDGIIVMDEIGFMEIGSVSFCDEVLKAFDSHTPILATIKDTELGKEYLDRIRKHPLVQLFKLSRENFDEVYGQILPTVKKWNRAQESNIITN